ncbi:MAG: RT0821/Lpp0805 family surface protein [Methyloceanibacter sp.]|uniref:RT0821/Lpp0805 family surface protein n=1 Tax=Methyloceanibacter sp. TaxID=1965321 RepID=UPI003D6C9FD2
MRLTPFIAIALVPLFLTACGPGNKQGTGTILGAVAGGAAGAAIGGKDNRAAGLAIGAVTGGILGNLIGADLDERDRQLAAQAQYQALEYGQAGQVTPWNNPSNQHRGQIVPGKPYQQGSSFCRPYTHTIYVSGQPQTARGTACRGPDGTWNVVG